MRAKVVVNKYIGISFILLLLAGCANSSHDPLVPEAKTTQYLTTGMVAGAAVSVPVGAVAGAIIGGYANSASELIVRMRAMGAQVVQMGDYSTILIPVDKLFGPKDDIFLHEIYTDNQPLLNLAVKFVNKFGNSAIKIAVSTDNIDTPKRNFNLAWRQANRVAAYFFQQGVSAWRLFPISYGADNKLATNRSVFGSRINRMIEITVNPHVTAADCCQHIAHFSLRKQPWQINED